MASLRRDLVERRLWPLVVVLIAAIVAVPILLRGHSKAQAEPIPGAPVVAPAPKQTSTHARAIPVEVKHRLLHSKVMRDPFAAGVSHLSSKDPHGAGSPSGSSTSTTSTTMVSPTPTSDTGSVSSGSVATGEANSGSSPTTVTQTTTVSAPTPTGLSVPTSKGPWTIYSVDVAYGDSDSKQTRHDVARLTPLPSPLTPKAMLLGVMAGGQQVAFALGAGVQARGAALCRPDHDRCSVIVLKPGQTEQLRFPLSNDTTTRLSFPAAKASMETMTLRVSKVSQGTTDSPTAALAAFRRVSEVGACELELGDPVVYNGLKGSVDAVISRACRQADGLVPFPGTVGGS